MRGYFRLFLTASLLFALLASCTSNVGQGFADEVVGRQEAAQAAKEEPAEPYPVKVTTYSDGQFSPELGFNVTSYPNDSRITAKKFFAIDDWYGQIEFDTADGLGLVLRAAPKDSGYLTTTYTELHDASDTARTVDGIDVRTRNSSLGCSMITWNRGDFQFLLHSNKSQGEPPKEIVDILVQETACQAA